MSSRIYHKADGTYGTGIDLKSSHRGNPSLGNVKSAASSPLKNLDQGKAAPTKIAKEVTHEQRDSDSVDAASTTETDSEGGSSSQRTGECFKTATNQQSVGNPDHWKF